MLLFLFLSLNIFWCKHFFCKLFVNFLFFLASAGFFLFFRGKFFFIFFRGRVYFLNLPPPRTTLRTHHHPHYNCEVWGICQKVHYVTFNVMSRLTFAEGVSAANLQNDLASQFLSNFVGRIDSAHITLTDKGRSKASISGEGYGITFDKIKTPLITKGVLFNPSLLEKLRLFFLSNDCPAYVSEKGAVSATAPAPSSKPSSDKVVSKEDLMKEKDEIKAKFFSLTPTEQETAKARMNEIETALKTA